MNTARLNLLSFQFIFSSITYLYIPVSRLSTDWPIQISVEILLGIVQVDSVEGADIRIPLGVTLLDYCIIKNGHLKLFASHGISF